MVARNPSCPRVVWVCGQNTCEGVKCSSAYQQYNLILFPATPFTVLKAVPCKFVHRCLLVCLESSVAHHGGRLFPLRLFLRCLRSGC